jgi:Ca2+-binding RTX toxin-like protein
VNSNRVAIKDWSLGTATANAMIGGRGNDALIGSGGADVLIGGQVTMCWQLVSRRYRE